MAEYKNTGDTPNTEKTFSPVYSYSQKISNLIAEGKITAPKYRTLSQEQMTTYYTAKDLPDYDMQKIKAGISRSNEQTFLENLDAAVTINAMDLLSSIKENTQMAVGNVLVTAATDPMGLVPLGAEIGAGTVGYSVGSKAAAKKAAQIGAGKFATKAAGVLAGTATSAAAGAAAGAAVGGILSAFHTSPAGDEFDMIVDEAKRRELQAKKTLEEKGFSPEEIEEFTTRNKVYNVGISMLRAANDTARQRAEVMPYVDPDSAALQIVGGIRSFGEMATVGWLAGAARAGIAKKALENKLGKTTTRFSKNEAVERLARIKGVETGSAASIGLMDVDIMGAGAIKSVQKYIEDTGDTELVNYKGDITNIAVDALNTRIQNIIEKKFGVPALFTKAVGKRITSKYGEWLNGFAQEFSQGVVNDFAEWTKGNQTAQDIVKNIPSNLVDGLIGAILQGGIGTAIYQYYHNESVNKLTDVIMAQSTKENPIDEQKARSFAESKINDLENEITNDITNEVVGFIDAKDYKGKIYETVRSNLQKAVDFQREHMKDTIEGSKYDEMTEDELAQHIESVAQDMTDRVVIHALDEKIPLSEVPQLKGETIDGQYYIEGASYAQDTMEQLAKEREAIRAVVYAERKAKADEILAEKMAEGVEIARTKREQAETAQQTKEAKERARAAEKSAKQMEKSVKASLKAQQEEMKAKVRAVNKEKTDTVDAIIHGNVDIIRDILSKNGLQTRELSGTGVKDLAKMNWHLFKGMNLGQSQRRGTTQVKLTDIARNVKSGDDVLKRAGFEQKEIDEMDDATWNKLVKEQYKIEREELGIDKEPEMTEEEIEQFLKDTEGLDWQDLADENARLDEIYPEYKGETIIVDGKERTVYNSKGERINKSAEALTNFWKWFGDSKVVDEQGRPLVVYHSTNAEFDTFKMLYHKTDEGLSGEGFYFTPSKEYSSRYGKIMMPVYLRSENLLEIEPTTDEQYMEIKNGKFIPSDKNKKLAETLVEKYRDTLNDAQKQLLDWDMEDNMYDSAISRVLFGNKNAKQILNEQGYDGVKYIGKKYDLTEYTVYDSTQIKSVDNRGTYSEKTGNIYLQSQQRGKGGAYDARTRSITLGAGANVTTLPHELAHYWIDKNFRWARSGHASEAWLKQWMAVEKWLGISPDDKRLDRNASEKFARAYERFLAEEQLPLVLKKSMADFRDFVLDHYDYELDDAKGLQDKLGRPIKLNEDVKAWFRKSIYENYMSPTEQAIVNERLAMADTDYKEVHPQVKEDQAIQETANTSAEITAPTGTEIQKEANVSNDTILGKKRTIGGGEEKESKGAIGQALGKTYESTNWDAQEEMVNNYLATVSTDEALDALDNDTYPDKIDPNFLRQALAEKLLEEGRELEAAALIEETADDFTESAQKLQAARRINTPFTNAIRMLTVGKAMKLAEAKYGKNKDAVKSLDAAINALVAKYEQDYANAQTDEERELVFATMQDEAIRTIGTLDKSVNDRIDFQDIEDKEARKQAKALRKRQIQRGSVKAYRSRAKRALKQALGLEPTREQVKEIKKLSVDVAKTIRDYRKAVKENKVSAIDPTSILEAQNKLNEYMNKQLPPRVLSNVADALNSYMMANMLWNPATNVFNVWSTWVQMIPHLAATYIDYGKGTIPFDQKLELIKQALVLQAKTGYNIFSLRDFFDKKTLWAEKYYEPQTKVGKVQAFPLTMLGLADTANKGLIFLTHADSMATKQAKEEGKKNGWTQAQIDQRAKELFYQALNTDPRTITLDGLKIREESVKEGEEATFTQMTRTAEVVNKIRRFLNLGQKTGVGSLIMPFTTTIANIAEDTVKNYALGSVRGLVNAPKALATQFDKTATAEMKKEAWKALKPETKNVIKNMIGVLMLLGIALDSDDEDYVLGYDRQTEIDKDIRQNRNAPSGYAIRIGNKWIDLDLFGIGSPYAKAYLIAKRHGFSPDGWVKGMASMIDLVPGISEIQGMYDKYSQTETWSGDWEALAEMGSDKASDILERLIPAQALFNQIGNIEDTSKRVSWNRWYDRAISKIPFLRRMLPERTSKQTGKVIPQTDVWWNLATGQRIKEYIEPAQADKARYEFAISGKALAYREGNSKLKELGKDSEKYNEAVQKVRKMFTAKLESTSKTSEYKNADIDEKRKIANNLHKDALEEVKKEYGLATEKKSAPKKKRKKPQNKKQKDLKKKIKDFNKRKND